MGRVFIITLLSLIFFASCEDDRADASLASAEMYIQEQPELSLELLESIDRDDLTTNKERARYSLLYSIALDKNYIDINCDSIISPAVNYYKNHGNANTRFTCYYYEARVYENAGDIDKALLCLSKAETLDTSKVEPSMLSLLYAMKGMIYDNAWRSKEALESTDLARKYALLSGKLRHYAYYTLSCAAYYRRLGDYDVCNQYLLEAEKYKHVFTLGEFHLFYDISICNMLANEAITNDTLEYFIEQYIENFPQKDMINWRNIARVYQKIGQIDQALKILDWHAEYNDISLDAGYHAVLSELKETAGDYRGALNAHKVYSNISDTDALKLHMSDLKLVEERYEHEITILRQRQRTSYLAAIVLLILFYLACLFYKWNKKRVITEQELEALRKEYEILQVVKEKISRQYTDAEAAMAKVEIIYKDKLLEYSRLEDAYKYLTEQSGREVDTSSEVLMILGYRMRSLAAFLQKPIPDSLSKVTAQIDNLKKNRNFIVDSIGILYAVNYPDFISELRGYGLTSAEIGYCCLFLLGLNMPEAVRLLEKLRVYIISTLQ